MRRDTLGRLGAQPISLLDAEPVLFVDDDHAEAMKLDGILQQRVRADDDARLTGGDLVAHLLASAAATSTRQQRDPRRLVGTTELSGHRQRPEHVADRSGMLGGKHFRGGQQRTLVAGVDHLQHRQHRDDGLARADLTLQHPVHRPTRRQFGRISTSRTSF